VIVNPEANAMPGTRLTTLVGVEVAARLDVPPAARTSSLGEIAMEATQFRLATRLRSRVTVNVYEAVVDTTLPLSVQLTKVHPLAGVAVTVAALLALYVPPPVVAPPFLGLTLNATK
jgi:hypothetical protein